MPRRLRYALLILPLCILTGCWDVLEIPRRGIASAVFFDKVNQRYKMGVSLAIPGSLVPPTVGTTQQFVKRYYIISAEGDSLVDAWTKVQANSERDIFFGQIRAVVMSEAFAHGNINDGLEFISRFPLVPPNTHVLVAKENPEQLFDLKIKSNEIPGNFVDHFFRVPAKQPLAPAIDLWRVNAMMDRSGDPLIPLIGQTQQNYLIAGTALFSRNRMVGELSLDESLILAMLLNTDTGYQSIPLGPHRHAAFKNIRAKTRITPNIDPDGTVVFNIDSRITGVLVEKVPYRAIGLRQRRAIEQQAETLIRENIQNLLAKLQSLNTDPLELGEKYRIARPRQWRDLNWHEVYPTVRFKVRAKFTVKDTGLFR